MAGLAMDHGAIDWYDAAQLAMSACRYYRAADGSDDLCCSFYVAFRYSLLPNKLPLKDGDNNCVLSGSKAYKSWLLAVLDRVSKPCGKASLPYN